ncbi:MAG: hypothetical protein IKX43_00585 [Paludibacteraceae bacterium]|nr:hypothetical protein [Paludibacteraceae bacterium]
MFVFLIPLFIKNPPEKEANLATKKEGGKGEEKSSKKRKSGPKSHKNAQKFISRGTYEELFTSIEEKIPHF